MRAATEIATIVVFTFQSSLVGIRSPRSGLKIDPFRDRATSRYGEADIRDAISRRAFADFRERTRAGWTNGCETF
jgi:hypothetical protein